MESRRSLMAKLHIARKDLGLDEVTYRAMLENLTGKRSAADCTDRQLVMLVAALRKRGWKDSRPKAPKVRPEFEEALGKPRHEKAVGLCRIHRQADVWRGPFVA